MRAYDFEYDGQNLSDFGFMICDFEKKGKTTVSNGSKITFVHAVVDNGTKYERTGVRYDTFLEAKFNICKNPCGGEAMRISMDEIRLLSRWLNRKEDLKFKLLSDEYQRVYFEGSFNIGLVKFNGEVYGLELEFKSNRPHALQEEKLFLIKNQKANGSHLLYDLSDEIGFIYPKTVITVQADGDLTILNSVEQNDDIEIAQGGRMTVLKNCRVGEVITMEYPIITSSDPSHKIQNDFNWNFFRIANSFDNNVNRLEISIPCSMEIRYNPIAKIGL